MRKAIVITLGVIIGVTGVLAICAHLADAARLALYVPEDEDDDDDEDYRPSGCGRRCCISGSEDGEDEDEELSYDGVMYDVTCPVCGEEITFDEDTLTEGSIICPQCGEELEFDLDGEDAPQETDGGDEE